MVFVCLLATLMTPGQVIDESDSKLVIEKSDLVLDLAITHTSRPTTAAIQLQLIDPLDKIRAEKSELLKLKGGKHRYIVRIPIGDLSTTEGDDFAWLRLSYRLGETKGTISLSEMMRDVFDLRVSLPGRIVPGSEYRIRVRALNPFAKTGVKKVAVDGKLTLDLDMPDADDEIELKAVSTTNGDGIAILKFKVPPGIRLEDDPEFEVSGRKNGFVRKVENDLDNDDDDSPVFITTDKPVYQPGETFNLRGLFLDASNTIVVGRELELKIEDENGQTVYSEDVTTSEYGIAAISWKIPEDTKLGMYGVEIDEREKIAFKITRYDVPNFVVTAETDKSFYLGSDQTAKVTVGANYLFGKPVTSGRVRIVREEERQWDFAKQKYDIDEGEVIEGTTDSNGKYVGTFDLTHEWTELKRSGWIRYQDLHFTAYFTDASTNRTEQKRLDVRITKEPIHIYFIHYGDQHPGLPMLAYVSTFYADGTPVECAVDVTVNGKTVDEFRTTPKGTARLKFAIPEGSLQSRKVNLRISAKDKRGQRGVFDESVDLNEENSAVQFETDKTIYAPGEAISLSLASTDERGVVYVDLLKNNVVLESLSVTVENGKGWLRIPYTDNYKGEIEIVAYTDAVRQYYGRVVRFSRSVIFPSRDGLHVEAKFDRKTYKPGDSGNLRLTVLNRAGSISESALGITLFDQAIEERAKTDGNFEGYFGKFSKLLGTDRSFGGVTLKDLNEIDTSRPIPEDMQMAAELILAIGDSSVEVFHSEFDADDAHTAYSSYLKKQLDPVDLFLQNKFSSEHTYPRDRQALTDLLRTGGIDFEKLRDPWGNSYVSKFVVDRSHLLVQLHSIGPDKRPNTPDDFVVLNSRYQYFLKVGMEIDTAVNDEFLATGVPIRDTPTLMAVLKKRGIDPALLIDAWGRPYRASFDIRGRNSNIHLSSLGPDGIQAANRWGGDDFDVANIFTDYFAPIDKKINDILVRESGLSDGKKFPRTIEEFKTLLRAGGLDLGLLRDGFGSPVYVSLAGGTSAVAPEFVIRGAGQNLTDTLDDIVLGEYSKYRNSPISVPGSRADIKTIEGSNAKGAIEGVVVDANGAVIPGLEVFAIEATDPDTRFVTSTNDEGVFLLANLPSGKYSVTVAAGRTGFKSYRQENIIVRSQRINSMTVTLEAGEVSSVVNVVASAEVDQSTNSTGTNITTKSVRAKIAFPYKEQNATPRLREYFPETLLWRPDLITDRRGRAEVNFKVADNITTWKMYAVASTKNGKVGIAEKEITSFQPFFVDLDPPKFLTEGDRISLPVQVRNYTEQKQTVNVSMTKGSWFTLTEGDRQNVEVEPGRSQNAIFGFRADSVITEGKQQVTATARKEGDSIERAVTVRPNGQEIIRTQAKLFVGSETLRADYPSNALQGTQNAEVKIYPNLFAHVGESVEGLLKRPYGCGEQTTSSTYPNVMILRFVKADTPTRRQALAYVQSGYKRLVGYQVADGGFSYWGGTDKADIPLTAYVLRFLNDAKEFIAVDETFIRRAEEFLAKAQKADGSWHGRYYGGSESEGTFLSTAYVARSIAMRKREAKSTALQKAFEFLDSKRDVMTDPYTLALFGLASLDAGETARAKSIAEQLRRMETSDLGSGYWDTKMSTPFRGWGKPARIETTALVVQLIARMVGVKESSPGLLFLLGHKDKHGVWYSTQTTINVLDALLASSVAGPSSASQRVDVFLGGELVQTILAEPESFAPVKVNLKGKLGPYSNLIEVRSESRSPILFNVVATHYIGWEEPIAKQSNDLMLDYKCDKTDAAIMAEITCSVESGRTSSRDGMLLAEIGLPPGADVSRESLDRSISGDSGVKRYEILPDRIVIYFWSRPGGTKFNFSFRPRYGIEAQTPASIVYDYYNPESQATLRPLKFSIK